MKFNKFDNRNAKHLSASVLDFTEKKRATINAYASALAELEKRSCDDVFNQQLARDMREVLTRKYNEARALLN